MPYYPSIDEDLTRAEEILAKGKAPTPTEGALDLEPITAAEIRTGLLDTFTIHKSDVFYRLRAAHGGRQEASEEGGTIHGGDIYAAYMLLKSFVEHIRYLHHQQDLGEAERERLERFKAKAIKLNRTAHETINMLLERQTELQVKLDAATERIARAMRES